MYTILKNDEMGKAIYIDNNKKRLWRMRERVVAWADYIDDSMDMYMITLTYDTKGTLGPASSWEKNDIRKFNLKMRDILKDDLIGYAWVIELTKNKIPHYHYLALVKKGVKIPYPDKNNTWEKGLTKIEKARTPFYILKYTGKEYQKDFENYPKGARLFAIWLRGKREDIRYKLLKEEDREIVDAGGWDLLKLVNEDKHSDWKLVGTAESLEYAIWLMDEENKVYDHDWFDEIYKLFESKDDDDFSDAEFYQSEEYEKFDRLINL